MFSQINKKYPEAIFVAKLLTLFSIFYFGTEFWIGITAKGNLYSAFCDEYLNYVEWLRLFILKGASIICNLFGHNTIIENTKSLKIVGGYRVNMVYSCIGFGILSSWAAFAIAYPAKLKKKIIWLFGGLLIICFINILRIAALLMLINKAKNIQVFTSHHTVFNWVAYILVLILIYFYTKEKQEQSQNHK